MSRLVLLTPSEEFAARAAAAGGLPVGTDLRAWDEEYARIDPSKVVAEVARGDVGVVLVGPEIPLEAALALAGVFDLEHPEICVVIVAERSADLLERALEVGARDVVGPDATVEELGRVIRRMLEMAERRRSKLRGEAAEAEPNRVITVLAPKGGSGKTALATNVAVGLSHSRPGQVALVDLDVQFGDVASALQIVPEQTIADVARSPRALDATAIKIYLSAHPSSLYTLCAPESPVDGDDVTAAVAGHAVGLLATDFRFVVVDTPAGLEEPTVAAVERATDLLFVCTTDVASVRSLRKEVDLLDQLGFTSQRRHYVLNRSDARVGLDTSDIEAVIGARFHAQIPSAKSVPQSMNEGVPLLESDPKSPVGRILTDIVERFAPPAPTAEPAAAEGRGRRWRRDGR